jgi:glycosyltransferase involved in cell wall biosynthesis
MHKGDVKISVIIPFYNGAAFLKEAIESVLSQEISNIEIIAIDDGSTDNSAEQIAKINDSRIKVIRQENAGAAAARNNGVQIASGDYISFLDADDAWAPNKLKLQIAEMEENADINMVFGQVKEFHDASVLSNAPIKPEEKTFVGYSPIALLISKEDFLKVGEFQGKYKVAEFIDWYDRAKHLGLKETVLPEIVAYRRIHSGNVDRLHRADVKQYVAVLKEALERRRKNLQ